MTIDYVSQVVEQARARVQERGRVGVGDGGAVGGVSRSGVGAEVAAHELGLLGLGDDLGVL